MKAFLQITLTIVILSMVLVVGSCRRESTTPGDRPVLSYSQPIVNPPDDFLILFNITSAGERSAEITFNTNAVWVIEKTGNPRFELLLNNGVNSRNINSVDTLGLQAGKKYRVVLFSAYYTEFINFFVGFRKTDLIYETFPDKF
ncbi:MAG TPA: hypothetical protein PKE03_00905 [Bacteroidales bacterium]|nr:hypothetical protein [Bacteroidales bacterium]